MTTMTTQLRSVLLCLALALLLGGARAAAGAEMELPRPSPLAKVTQDVGLTTITVDYSQPGVKNRKIWGGLVPFDKMWRTGANRATKIVFSRDVTFAGKPVPAGTYALFTIPTKGDWTVILNKRADQPGTAQNYKQDEDLLRVQLKPKAGAFRERMTFFFSNFGDDKTLLDLEWEKVRVEITIRVNTADEMASRLRGLDDAWRSYANAARYMLETKKDYDTGLKYIDQSLSLKEEWFNLWIKAQLLAAKGNYKEAYPLAEKAYAIGEKNPGGFFLEGEVKSALSQWKKKV